MTHESAPQGPRLLLVGRNPTLSPQLASFLKASDFDVYHCEAGEHALQQMHIQTPDAILLEAVLPDQTGLQWLQALRKTHQTPVILVSLSVSSDDRVSALHSGADDCLSLPVSPDELLARLQALLRRINLERTPNHPGIPLLQLDAVLQDALYAGQRLGLTRTEHRLLAVLLSQPGRVFDKTALYDTALNRPFGQHDRSLDMHISHLRKKLARVGYPAPRLQTVWGKGYRLQE